MSKYAFTIFTPTYNRAYTLRRTFESIKMQTYRDFEWLVIDNCSTDNTDSLMQEFINEANFPIRYLKQVENLGKHNSCNRGVLEANGELLVEIYSDDALLPTALERFKYHWESISDIEKNDYIGIAGLCQNQFRELIGDKFPEEIFDSNYAETTFRYGITGEKCAANRVDVLRKFLSPTASDLLKLLPFEDIDPAQEEIREGDTYVCESMMWNNIARFYKTRYINEFVRIFYIDNRSDRLTLAGIKKSVLTSVVNKFYLIEYWHRFFLYSPLIFITHGLFFHYHRILFNKLFRVKYRLNFGPCLQKSQSFFVKFFFITLAPLGYLVYFLKRRKHYK